MPPAAKKPCKTPNCGKARWANSSWCFSCHKKREKAKREERKSRKLARKIASKTFQNKERKKLHRKCWKLMSELVRRQGADFRGYVRCYTCRTSIPWKETHCSHRHHGKLDFDERNLRACCVQCNTYLHGNLGEYERRLIEENGLEWAKQLKNDADIHPGYRLEDLKVIYEELQRKLSQHPFLS